MILRSGELRKVNALSRESADEYFKRMLAGDRSGALAIVGLQQTDAPRPSAVAPRKMPAQKPGRSKQDYATPWEFINAVERRFGRLTFDLAAHQGNVRVRLPDAGKKPSHCYYGPGSPLGEDTLAKDWRNLRGNAWLNPEFRAIEPYAEKCAKTRVYPQTSGPRILFLVPASVGSRWFSRWVHKKALVLALEGRLSFDGKGPYPKDMILACYGEPPGFEVWPWRVERKGIQAPR